ncbi:DUF2505 domain-containing protein [Salinifilum ghardaiensis]
MTRRIEHRSTNDWPAARVFAALIDVECLRERLDALSGQRAALVAHEPTPDEEGARYQVRHSIALNALPSAARSVIHDDLTLDRSESWRPTGEGYAGELAAEVRGVPCSITGSMWLHDLPGPGAAPASELVVSGTVRVGVPLVGGKLEDLAAEQVQKLLTEEEQFTTRWLARRG